MPETASNSPGAWQVLLLPSLRGLRELPRAWGFNSQVTVPRPSITTRFEGTVDPDLVEGSVFEGTGRMREWERTWDFAAVAPF